MFSLDADATQASLEKVRAWDFDRVVLAHGRRIESGGRQVLDTVIDRLLQIARQRGPLRRRVNALLARF